MEFDRLLPWSSRIQHLGNSGVLPAFLPMVLFLVHVKGRMENVNRGFRQLSWFADIEASGAYVLVFFYLRFLV